MVLQSSRQRSNHRGPQRIYLQRRGSKAKLNAGRYGTFCSGRRPGLLVVLEGCMCCTSDWTHEYEVQMVLYWYWCCQYPCPLLNSIHGETMKKKKTFA